MGVYFQHYYPELNESYLRAYNHQGSDAVACAIHLGNMAEGMVRAVCQHYGVRFDCEIYPDGNGRTRQPDHNERLAWLAAVGWMSREQADVFHRIRRLRNRAAHGDAVELGPVRNCLFDAEGLIAWFEGAMQASGAAPSPPVKRLHWKRMGAGFVLLFIVLPILQWILPKPLLFLLYIGIIAVGGATAYYRVRTFFLERENLAVKMPLHVHIWHLFKNDLRMWWNDFVAPLLGLRRY